MKPLENAIFGIFIGSVLFLALYGLWTLAGKADAKFAPATSASAHSWHDDTDGFWSRSHDYFARALDGSMRGSYCEFSHEIANAVGGTRFIYERCYRCAKTKRREAGMYSNFIACDDNKAKCSVGASERQLDELGIDDSLCNDKEAEAFWRNGGGGSP